MRRILVCEEHNHNYPQYLKTEVCPECATPTIERKENEIKPGTKRKEGTFGKKHQDTLGKVADDTPTDPLRSLSEMSGSSEEARE